MITQFQVDDFLKKELPILTDSAILEQPSMAAFPARTAIQHFLDYTRSELQAHHRRKVKKCFAVAGRLYENGDVVVRMLIENLCVYSFSFYMPKEDKQRRSWIKLIPPKLYDIYCRQMLNPGY